MTNKQKILFISNSSPVRISHMLDAFNNRNDLILEEEHLWIDKRKNSFLNKVFDKLKLPLDNDGLNKRILKKVKDYRPDIIFIVKGNNIYPWTLKKIKDINSKIKLVSFSNDNMGLWHNKSLFYHYGINYYDLILSINIEVYKVIENIFKGPILYLDKSYSSKYHYPLKLDKKYDVLFIGSYEKERYQDLNFLAEQGIKIDIFGAMWNKLDDQKINNNLKIHFQELIGDKYREAISSAKITLGFLRKINFDTQTSRTFEIPACGGFMLMERTENHKRLFTEGEEAAYFSDKDELLRQIKYYLYYPKERNRIANQGRKRCETAGYSYDERINIILEEINKL